jgi:hypothetical protein
MTVSVSVREAEVHALTLWVEPSCQALGDWVLRTVAEAPGLRLPRTNSCLAIGDPGLPLRAAVGSVNAFYDSLGRTPLVQVEAGSEIERAFLAAGWAGVPTEDTSFHVADHAEALAGWVPRPGGDHPRRHPRAGRPRRVARHPRPPGRGVPFDAAVTPVS